MDNLAKILSWIGQFEDNEETNEYLKSKEYDIEELEKKGENSIKKIIADTKLKKAERKRELLDKAEQLFRQSTNTRSVSNILGKLNQESSLFQFQFSKLESIDEIDALSMLDDQQLLLLIEELEKEEDG